MRDLDEAEQYAIAGLFTLALHSQASFAEGFVTSEDNADSWGYADATFYAKKLIKHAVSVTYFLSNYKHQYREPYGESLSSPSTNNTNETPLTEDDLLAFWGRDLVATNGLLEHVYTQLQLPPNKWSGLKALACVAPATDRQAHASAVRSLVKVLDPVLAASLPELLTRPKPREAPEEDASTVTPITARTHPGYLPSVDDMLLTGDVPDSPSSEEEASRRPDMKQSDQFWEDLLTSSDDEEFLKDQMRERAIEERQRRAGSGSNNGRRSAAVSPKHIDGSSATNADVQSTSTTLSAEGQKEQQKQSSSQEVIIPRENPAEVEAETLLRTLSDSIQNHPDHTELAQRLEQLEIESMPNSPMFSSGGKKQQLTSSSTLEEDDTIKPEEEPASTGITTNDASTETTAAETSSNNESNNEKDTTAKPVAVSASPAAVATLWELVQCSIVITETSTDQSADAIDKPNKDTASSNGGGSNTTASSTVHVRWYDSRARVAIRQVAMWLQLPWRKVITLEVLLGSNKVPSDILHRRIDAGSLAQSGSMRYLKVGLAAGAGGILFAVTGGLAAPAIAAGVGTVLGLIPGAAAVTAPVAGFMATQAGLAAVTGTMAGAGAATTGTKMAHRTADVTEFGFLELPDVSEAQNAKKRDEAASSSGASSSPTKKAAAEASTKGKESEEEALPVLVSRRPASEGIRLSTLVCISGWISTKDDFVTPWLRVSAPASDRFACIWETSELMALDSALGSLLAKQVAGQAVQLGVKHLLTAGAGLLAALAPTVILGTAAGLVISNAWVVASDRAEKAGKVLAAVLMAGAAGERPVTLIAHGMGARLAFHCLLELARQGARGIVQDVVLLGANVGGMEDRWRLARRAVAGRLINGYSRRDWLLSMFHWDGVAAGLAPVEVPAVENVSLGGMVGGHLDYIDKIEDIVELLQLEI